MNEYEAGLVNTINEQAQKTGKSAGAVLNAVSGETLLNKDLEAIQKDIKDIDDKKPISITTFTKLPKK